MSFAEEIAAGGNSLMETTMKIARKATGNLCDNVIDRTPVLTRYLQSGWVGGDSAEAFPAEFGGAEQHDIRSAEETKSNLRAAIERWDGMRPFFAYNPTLYGPRIEFEGWSWKAPAGMVRVAAAMWPFFVRDAAREVGGV
jgi:hypothetical protein